MEAVNAFYVGDLSSRGRIRLLTRRNQRRMDRFIFVLVYCPWVWLYRIWRCRSIHGALLYAVGRYHHAGRGIVCTADVSQLVERQHDMKSVSQVIFCLGESRPNDPITIDDFMANGP